MHDNGHEINLWLVRRGLIPLLFVSTYARQPERLFKCLYKQMNVYVACVVVYSRQLSWLF